MAQGQTTKKSRGIPSGLIILVAIIIAEVVFHLVFGAASNFKDPAKKEATGFLGLIYKGGEIVPFLIAMLICVFAFSIERYLTVRKAYGTGSLETFLQNIKSKLV